MNYSSVDELKSYFSVQSDEDLAKKLAELGLLRKGARQTVYLWNGQVPQNIQNAIELMAIKSQLSKQATA